MRGRIPKPPGQRARRNRVSTAAVLPSVEEARKRDVPPLPARDNKAQVWHPEVVAWWEEVWRSPMASEYLGPDVRGGLYLLAELYQLRWTCSNPEKLPTISAEIRLQEPRFGLSPIDRRRLQWEVEKGDQAEERTQRRRQQKDLDRVSKKDPRDVLKAV